ncbi:MAG: KpsF/GutQ family sugar-phosphate isomerase [Paracoccaceae bacterium]|jgi:arabinose-5-phosphate isomerase|nr:KpsF/GutQ family sugar-phosphate isomerase [Paracoccaceae bacterium]NCV49217.1 KpsF/GutQ family sugar-phosphate isomerase [Rhodobacterales bacterium]NDA29138.1 KpsF/GutQ family sugar-phosphate isomerase [Alphaproteobacteria bacterium]NCW06678.1 KpsF/GutQ family sugar-phosphate isomerase [Rhodobacterales bacterium]NCX57594.1 KpsF/GutQ family sugar-phosphate isomerase [Paracoccaceae bacterium]|tara:strand:+ start:219 stop:1175 length:957 start_codon:yes stop_codon:yes gene_type:complete
MANSFVQAAKKVLQTEADALETLKNDLPNDFSDLVKLILNLNGRVIVSGVGKSGHIGNKIAATLASTGTPAYFVHATEASHGDLGMITEKDLCLLISNSGETSEIFDIVAHARRFSIPVATISSNTESTLVKAADFKLCLPVVEEACPIGMAPTTSTTMMLALGDALAVALMEAKNFNTENFKVLHPGGKLGAKMMMVSQVMHKSDALPLVETQTSMKETLLTMSSRGFGIAAVVNEKDFLVGVITDGDLRRHINDLMSKTAGEIASLSPITVVRETFVVDALKLMQENKITVLIVTSAENKPVGILHIQDLLKVGAA